MPPGLTIAFPRSSAGEKGDSMSELPAIPVASITTAAELDLAVKASKPLVLKGLVEHWPAPWARPGGPGPLWRPRASIGCSFRCFWWKKFS